MGTRVALGLRQQQCVDSDIRAPSSVFQLPSDLAAVLLRSKGVREGGFGGSVWPWSTSVPWGYALDWSNQLCFRVSLQGTTLAARVGNESHFLYGKVTGGD